MACIIGIDPGVTGAIAVIRNSITDFAVHDLPITQLDSGKYIAALDLIGILRNLRRGESAVAYLERVHAMPKNGSVAAFSQGCTFGAIVAAIEVAGIPLVLVTPIGWKSALGVRGAKGESDRARKERSLGKARLLFPNAPLERAKDHGRAEALLIAYYGSTRGGSRIVEKSLYTEEAA